jgi:phosphate/sulfate permease
MDRECCSSGRTRWARWLIVLAAIAVAFAAGATATLG